MDKPIDVEFFRTMGKKGGEIATEKFKALPPEEQKLRIESLIAGQKRYHEARRKKKQQGG